LALACALGRSGVRVDKREGDGATPVGTWLLRRVLYRADKLTLPAVASPAAAIRPTDGWCDDPADASYNRSVQLPYGARTEQMWRDDDLYDVVVILGHNDDPPVAGLGSAIFMHVARPDLQPTEGCIALALEDLMAFLTAAPPFTSIRVAAP
jgi:L,D-peptidoglycan transpeptidase YkuD (ErfK/YbiS/YcfS/YnhG family)